MVAINILERLIYSVWSDKKMASWGYFVLLFDPFEEPAARPGGDVSCFPGESESGVKVRPATSCDHVSRSVESHPMD